MEYITLTGCGISVSRICFGAMTLGGQVDEATGLTAVDMALDAGVNFFDTANIYTGGRSEEIMGKAMSGRRDRFVLATKAGLPVREGPNGRGLSRSHLVGEIEDSLRRLKTDYIDVYYMHAPDTDTPVQETLSALDALVKSGKVRYIGASNFAAWQLCRLRHTARESGWCPPVMAQMVYNLVTRGIEQELVPFLKEYRMGLIVYNPLAGGLLTEKYAEKKAIENARLAANEIYKKRYWNEENLRAWDEVRRIAGDAGIGMVQLSYRWLLGTGNVDTIITGFSSLDQLRSNLEAAAGGPLPAEIMTACDSVWNGLAGTRFKYNR